MRPTDFLSNGQVNMEKVQELIDRLGHIMNETHGETYAEYLTSSAAVLNKRLSENGPAAHEHLVTKSGVWRVAREADEIIAASKLTTNEKGFIVRP